MRDRLQQVLDGSPRLLLPLWAVICAFTTYFCMYAFRKPFSAGTYEGLTALGGEFEFKTVILISQVLGYTISKYAGIKVCAELSREKRVWYLLGAIAFAQFALYLFAVLPMQLKIVAIFMNGLPLGMVWGFVVSYLEGRRTSEGLLAGLSCAYIIASGYVKSAGLWIMATFDISEFWMPFATGAAFLPIFVVAVWLLNMTPEPNQADIEERVKRVPMDGRQRWEFFKRFALGLSLLIFVYFFLTAYRDFRDSFGIEIFYALGYTDEPGIFARSETFVAFGVMAVLFPIAWIHDNKKALMAVFGLLVIGCIMIGVSTAMLQAGMISGLTWMIIIGLGAYFAYVPYGSVLFDRVVAATRTIGTAVFAIYLTDAVGYTGSVFLMIFKDQVYGGMSHYEFFVGFSYVMAVGGAVLLGVSYFDFARAANRAEQQARLEPAMEAADG